MRVLPSVHTFRHMVFEIVIVVIGVLVALAVNDWQQQRHERQFAIQQLESLSQEVDQNLNSLHTIRDRVLVHKLQALGTVIATLQGKAPLHISDPKAFIKTLEVSASTAGLWFQHSRFDALRSTGSFRILDNASLEKKLNDTYNGVPILFAQLKQLEPGYPVLVQQLVPARYQSELNPLRGYVGGHAPVVQDRENDTEFVQSLKRSRSTLLRMARGEASVATANWYALTRLKKQFLNVQAMLRTELARDGTTGTAPATSD